ncbi:hypothetical protein FA13DRAFT_1717395 [Coprinellus micaceus]|uniref:Uncharacterized protein n=1 Tax=Coprinellus micaceus TaxID=71717 RepID=A0A4Y7SI77_COPMI|nr:hypothetical protein FA13DRAFT_1717395 [Coprinellus micaceus]
MPIFEGLPPPALQTPAQNTGVSEPIPLRGTGGALSPRKGEKGRVSWGPVLDGFATQGEVGMGRGERRSRKIESGTNRSPKWGCTRPVVCFTQDKLDRQPPAGRGWETGQVRRGRRSGTASGTAVKHTASRHATGARGAGWLGDVAMPTVVEGIETLVYTSVDVGGDGKRVELEENPRSKLMEMAGEEWGEGG